MNIRHYETRDYLQIKAIYQTPHTFGGQFDEARDTQVCLDTLASTKPGSILVAEKDEKIVGTVTIFEDGRECWLYRFAILEEEHEIARALYQEAVATCREWGHKQLLVYAPAGDMKFQDRYTELGFHKGNDYTAYWVELV